MTHFNALHNSLDLELGGLPLKSIMEVVVSQTLFSHSIASQKLIGSREVQYDIEGIVILKAINRYDEVNIIDVLVSDGVPFDVITTSRDRFGFRPGEGIIPIQDTASSDDLLIFSNFEVPQEVRPRRYF
jgi:hypothetical protein